MQPCLIYTSWRKKIYRYALYVFVSRRPVFLFHDLILQFYFYSCEAGRSPFYYTSDSYWCRLSRSSSPSHHCYHPWASAEAHPYLSNVLQQRLWPFRQANHPDIQIWYGPSYEHWPEAVETADKLSRKWACMKKGVLEGKAVLSVEGNFHGRTLGIIRCLSWSLLLTCLALLIDFCIYL